MVYVSILVIQESVCIVGCFPGYIINKLQRALKMSGNLNSKKIKRKLMKCCSSLMKLDNIKCVDEPTNIVFVGNAGLVCGFDSYKLLDLFQKYGSIEKVITLPDRSYSFVVFDTVENATRSVNDLNGKCVDFLNDKPIYLAFAEKLPGNNENGDTTLPPDALLLVNFVTEEEEMKLLELEPKIHETREKSLKHRLVWHYGYEFNYYTNNIDTDKPLQSDIPTICQRVMRCMLDCKAVNELPDQITCNRYAPGQGIPPHVDTHSAFEDPILSLSLGSDLVMDFTHISGRKTSVFLPRRSLLVMKGESRYGWTHGIACRKNDIVPKTFLDKDGKSKTILTLLERSTRTSFTFRKIRRKKCHCNFRELCDSQKENLEISEELAKMLENKHVFEVYDHIAEHFSETRFKPWPHIASFLSDLPPGSFLIDVGCGNGKYLGRNNNLIELGCDLSGNLLSICKERNLEVAQCNVLQLPFRNNCADACLCIAVLHHLSTAERRRKSIQEIIRILTTNGEALIYVWSMEQETNEGVESNYLKKSRCRKVEDKNQTMAESGELLLPVHTNRTKFLKQDLFVPWKSKETLDGESGPVFHRFYHVFTEGELEKLVENVDNVKIVKSFYDKGNWCVILKKI